MIFLVSAVLFFVAASFCGWTIKNKIEPKRIRFVYENVNKESTLVLVEGQKCGKVGLKVENPFILYNEDGSETEEYKKLLVEVK